MKRMALLYTGPFCTHHGPAESEQNPQRQLQGRRRTPRLHTRRRYRPPEPHRARRAHLPAAATARAALASVLHRDTATGR